MLIVELAIFNIKMTVQKKNDSGIKMQSNTNFDLSMLLYLKMTLTSGFKYTHVI